MTGSHLDSQPSGGRYDGAYGVLAGLEALLAVRAAAANRGIETGQRNIAVVNWTNEEGARFSPSTLGSAVYAGVADADFAHSRVDGDGVTLGDALAKIGYRGGDAPPRNVAAYVELHIEQGPELERAGKTIGVVEGNWGTIKYVAEMEGRAAHTGPTPMAERGDCVVAGGRTGAVLPAALRRDRRCAALVGRSTRRAAQLDQRRGRVWCACSPNFVRGDPAMLSEACTRFEARAQALSTASCARTNDPHGQSPGGHDFDAGLRDVIERAANECGAPVPASLDHCRP